MTILRNTVLRDSLENEVEVGLFGELKTAEGYTQISLAFDKPLNTESEVTVTGTPSAMINRSLLQVVNGESVQTKDVLRYRTAQTIETYFTANFVGTFNAGSSESYIGLFDSEDGVFLGYLGDNFVVGYRNINKDGGTEPDVTQTITPTWTVGNIHRYRIRFGYLGVGNITYEVYTGTKWEHIHTFITDGAFSDRTHIGTTILPIRAQVEHAGCTIYSGSWNSHTYGRNGSTQEIPFFTKGSRTIGVNAGEELPIVAFRNKTTFGGYNNKIRAKLLVSEFATDSEGLYSINFYAYPAGTFIDGDPGTVGASEIKGNFTDINSNSILQVSADIAAGASVTYSSSRFSTFLAVSSSGTGVASSLLDFELLGLIAGPGDEFLVTKECIVAGVGSDATGWNISYVDLR